MSTLLPKIEIYKLFIWLYLSNFNILTLDAVEFSQFYLPPCCHLAAHPPTAAVVASSPSEQNGTLSTEPAYPRSSTSGEELVDEEGTTSVYKLIVPLKFQSAKAAISALESPPQHDGGVEAAPPIHHHERVVELETTTVSPIATLLSSLSPTTSIQQTQKETVNDASSDNVFNVFLYKELEKMRGNRGEHPLPLMNPPYKRTETVFDKIAKLGYTMSERLQQLSSKFQTIASPPPGSLQGLLGNSFQNSHGPYEMYKTFAKRQTVIPDPTHLHHEEPMKMPAVWIKNLRKALYQSLTKRSNTERQTASVQSSPNSLDDSKVLWKNLRTAKLKFIDLGTRSASELPEEIYLPPGQGPIVSGIAILAAGTGKWEIRIPSELYTPSRSDNQGAGSGEGTTDLCKCSLVNDGDMILAYWSISRIITDDGQPALQYLVYPHPYPHHTVHLPTPPQLIPFSDGGPHEFRPSPYDPLPNYLNEITKVGNHHKLPIVTDGKHRSPKFYDGNHQINGKLEKQHPSLGLHLHPLGGGVPIIQNGKYTDDFLSLYRDAINHHFHNIDSMKSMMITNDGNIEGFINQHVPQQPPHVPAPLTPSQEPHHLPDIPYGGSFVEGPPTSIPGIATPVDLNLNDHPKSIQDIISPFVPPPPPPQQLPPPRQPNHGNVDDGLYYDDGRKYQQNPNISPLPFQGNRPVQPVTQQKPFNNSPLPYNGNGVGYDGYYNDGRNKPYYPNGQYDQAYPQRDLPKKQAYVKEYFYNNYKLGGKYGNFAQRTGRYGNGIGGSGGSLNDIDNPDGYILDFKR